MWPDHIDPKLEVPFRSLVFCALLILTVQALRRLHVPFVLRYVPFKVLVLMFKSFSTIIKGKYNPNVGSSSSTACVACPDGTYLQNGVSLSCFPCPAGFIPSAPPATSCNACVAGYTALPYSSVCSKWYLTLLTLNITFNSYMFVKLYITALLERIRLQALLGNLKYLLS